MIPPHAYVHSGNERILVQLSQSCFSERPSWVFRTCHATLLRSLPPCEWFGHLSHFPIMVHGTWQNLQAGNSTCKEAVYLCQAESANKYMNLEMSCLGRHSCQSCEPKLKQQCFKAGTGSHSCSACTGCPTEFHHLTGKHQVLRITHCRCCVGSVTSWVGATVAAVQLPASSI